MRAALAHPGELELSPLDRLGALCDPGSLELIRTGVRSRDLGARARAGDGVAGGSGLVNGRPVFCYAQDPRHLGGSLGAEHAQTIVRVLELAARASAPVVGFVASGGARLQEGVEALGGYGRVFRHIVGLSGRVPQISVITGQCAGGGAYAPALTDWVVMVEDACMFLTGPGVVREALGEDISADQLGGRRVHERNGVCHFVAPDVLAAAHLTRDLLGYLSPHDGVPVPTGAPARDGERDPAAHVPSDPRKVYDVREVIACLADGAQVLEVAAGWARNLVTALIRIDRRTVGVLANQPRYLGGALDADAAQKGARFVEKCDAFGIPLLVLEDTPGFMPGARQEQAGVIRLGAGLVRAFARATVPRITVILRKAFGGAFITMNSKDLGADYVFAWPQAQIGVMGARPAVAIIRRREIAAAEDQAALHAQLTEEYAREQLDPLVAAAAGYVDELIAPADTRRRVARGFRSLRESG